MKNLVFATNNKHKIEELYALLGKEYQVLTLKEAGFTGELREDFETFEENATQKAQLVFDELGIPVIADDSGLEVKSLDMRPGVFSARYAGINASDEMNNQKLLEELDGIPDRTAQFVTVIALVDETGVRTYRGSCKGTILAEKRGGSGFGYDPLFVPEHYKETFAELGGTVKQKISHRANALKLFLAEMN